MNYKFFKSISEEQFNEFAITHPQHSIFQTSEWTKVKEEWNHLFTAVILDDKIVAASIVLIRKLPLNFTLFYLPRGPLIDYENEELLTFYFDELKKVAKSYHALSIKVDPNILLNSTPYDKYKDAELNTNNESIDALKKYGFKHFGLNKDMYSSSQPRYTMRVYYEDDFETQANKMKAKKNINKAIKKGLELEELDYDRLNIFADIMKKTEESKSVSLRSLEYFQRIYKAFGDDCYVVVAKLDQKKRLGNLESELSKLHEEKVQENLPLKRSKAIDVSINSIETELKVLNNTIQQYGDVVYISGGLSVKTGDTLEQLYAGINRDFNQFNGSYLTQFDRIRWGYNKGCKVCNLGGVPGTLDDGLTMFKYCFNPNVEEYVGEFDLPVNKIVYPIFNKTLPIVKKLLKKLRRRH